MDVYSRQFIERAALEDSGPDDSLAWIQVDAKSAAFRSGPNTARLLQGLSRPSW